MAMARLITSQNLRCLRYISQHRFITNILKPSPALEISTFSRGFCQRRNEGAQFPSGDCDVGSKFKAQKQEDIKTATPHPPRFAIFPAWVRWILGTILSLLPFWKKKWEKILQIEDKVEEVAEVVEAVAEATEKVASKVADKLPDDGKLKAAVLLVEHASKEVAEDAKVTINFIHKVDEVKQEVELLMEPIIDPRKDVERSISPVKIKPEAES